MNQFLRLIVMIPAYNESETIASVISSIPKSTAGVAETKVMVLDDGSSDNTVEAARTAGADFVFSNLKNRGLAKNFARGLSEALSLGADIIVNFDADGQYEAKEIGALIQPILQNKADIVIGNRQVEKLRFMPFANRYGNLIGSWLVRKLSNTNVRDASSGFRAYNREAALRLNTFSPHTYTHESIIDASNKGLRMEQIDCSFYPTKRSGGKSRLIGGVFNHIRKSGMIIIRTFVLYKPLKFFFNTGSLFILISVLIGLRFVYYYFVGQGEGKIQSLILMAVLAIIGFMTIVIGFLADAANATRQVSEEILYRQKRTELTDSKKIL